MQASYSVLRVAGGDNPLQVVEAMLLHPEGQHVYVPPEPTGKRTFSEPKLVGEEPSLTHVNHEWLQKWHHENPDYELRDWSSEGSWQGPQRVKTFFPSDDPHDPEAHGRHHAVNGFVHHKPSNDKVGEFSFSLARWPLISRAQHSNIVTSHIHSVYHYPTSQEHPHILTHLVDSWLNHTKDHGVRHVYVNEDMSDGYWLKQVTKHPEMVWGGVEFRETKGHTTPYDDIASRRHPDTRRPDLRGARIIHNRQDLFRGWPGYHESVDRSELGMLHVSGKYSSGGSYNDDDRTEHHEIARRLGYKSVPQALKDGWVRHIRFGSDPVDHYYEFYDSPEARRSVSSHLAKSRPSIFDGVVVDAYQPEGEPGAHIRFDSPSKAHAWLRSASESLGEMDAFIMRWNRSHAAPTSIYGPIPNTVMRFDRGMVRRHPGHLDKGCYTHALKNYKANPKLKLAVGFTVSKDDAEAYERGEKAPLMFTHAFNVNQHGDVHDTTLGTEHANRMRYYGHVVPDDVARTFKNGNDVAGWFGKHFQTGTSRITHAIHTGLTRGYYDPRFTDRND